jgi:antitoxin (DNA-binding transcriptional repressor) of toxin-antitoxin stability system
MTLFSLALSTRADTTRKKAIKGSMAKDVIHISDKEAASDFASLLARVREGAEVIVEHDARPVAVVRPAEVFRGRLLSESIALAEAHAKELGYEPTMDAEFAPDLTADPQGRSETPLTEQLPLRR